MTVAADVSHLLDGANEAAALTLAMAGVIAILLKVWKAQKAAVIKAHEAAKVMDRVASEFKNDHGSSMKDAVDRLESGQLDQARQLQVMHEAQTSLIKRVDDAYALFAHVITINTTPEEKR